MFFVSFFSIFTRESVITLTMFKLQGRRYTGEREFVHTTNGCKLKINILQFMAKEGLLVYETGEICFSEY